jgi:hypothetical protein
MRHTLLYIFIYLLVTGCEKDPVPPPATPAVETSNIIAGLTRVSVVCSGNVTGSYGSAVLEKGICWSGSTLSPSINSNKQIAGGVGEGAFSCTLTGLIPARVYYFRAYAINNIGVAYGSVYSFKTLN